MRGFKFTKSFNCLVLAIICLLTSCSPVYEHMPEMTEVETVAPVFDEYFTTGEVASFSSGILGVAYEGQWIYVESLRYCIKEDNPKTLYDDSVWESKERLVKYNPITRTVSSLCLDPTCMHSTDECIFCAPRTWLVSYFEIFGDWIMYTFADYFSNPSTVDTTRTYLYNLKSGESRQLHSNSKEGELLSRTTTNYVMNGKIYSTLLQLDYTGEEEFTASESDEEFEPETHQFVEVYDPATDKVDRLCEVPEDLLMFGMTNKRFLFKKSDRTYWSTDYNGENLKEEKLLCSDTVQLCGTYAYFSGENPDYTKLGYNYRGYDLETDSMFYIDFGGQIRHILVDSGKLGYTTMSKIDEFRRFVKNMDAYVKERYPKETDKQKLAELKIKLYNELQYDGVFQLYITDALGNNKQLVFEGENMNISPYRISGNYLYGKVSYADPNNDFEVTIPGNEGLCALNLETGEITLIPQLEIHLDQQ